MANKKVTITKEGMLLGISLYNGEESIKWDNLSQKEQETFVNMMMQAAEKFYDVYMAKYGTSNDEN